MNINIHFRHMERSDALENLVTNKVTRALEHCLHRPDANIDVWLISERNLTNRGTGWFICEIEVRYPPRKRHFIRKEGDDMHIAIQDAADAVRTLIDEEGKKENQIRKHSPPAADVAAFPEDLF